MRTLIAIAFLSTAVFAESASFEVRELAADVANKLSDAEAKLATSMEALAAAQKAVESARQERDSARAEALNSIDAYAVDGECAAIMTEPSVNFVEYRRLFTRVEIRGKYALITAGMENCLPSLIIHGGGITTAPADQLHGSPWIFN